jgi:hypothetical protein
LKVAVLCSGPSLAEWIREPGFVSHCDVRIGVNRAVAGVACEWWVANDRAAFETIAPIGRPCAFSPCSLGAFKTRDWWGGSLPFFAFDTSCPDGADWTSRSMYSALVLAEYVSRDHGERQIELYGADLAGDTYYNGFTQKQPINRWEGERAKLAQYGEWFRELGIRFARLPAPRGKVVAA